MFRSMRHALPLLQWLLRTISPNSAPDCPTVLEVRVPISQSVSVSVAGCVLEGCNRATRRLPKASPTCSLGFKSGENAGQSIRVISSLFPVAAEH
ncbi:hypothetical protein TNCV_3461861 [Trichonephila clavipes]|nr:hypothetical protein TNCV_3461861 [Trichonephila clavipes]